MIFSSQTLSFRYNMAHIVKLLIKKQQYLEQIGVLSSNSNEIILTKNGKDIAKELIKNENKNVLNALNEYKKFLNDLSSKELLAYVYSAYSDMIEESVEYENLKLNMENYILSSKKTEN